MRELHNRNPRRPDLDRALGLTTDELVGKYVNEENYAAARVLLRELAVNYPEHPVVVKWREHLTQLASPLFADARSAADAGQWTKAGELIARVAAIWPELPGARKLAQTISHKYPSVVVGVGSLATDILPNRFDDWTTRRTEPVVVSDAGGVRRSEHRRRKIRLSGRRNHLGRPRPTAGHSPETRHQIGSKAKRP